MSKSTWKAQRVLELIANGVPSAAICERLGISRDRLYQIKRHAEKPREKVAPQWGEVGKSAE